MQIRETIEQARAFTEEAGYRLSSDTSYPNRYWYELLRVARNQTIIKYAKNPFAISDAIVQEIECVPLEKIDRVETKAAPSSGNKLARSVNPIPDILVDLPIRVTTVDGEEEYGFVSYEHIRHRRASRIPANRKGKYYSVKERSDGTYLYILNDSDKVGVRATLIAEEPLDVMFYKTCGDEQLEYNPLDREFVISEDMLPEIFARVYNMLVNGKSIGRIQDVRNDDRNETIPAAGQSQQ